MEPAPMVAPMLIRWPVIMESNGKLTKGKIDECKLNDIWSDSQRHPEISIAEFRK